jgi:hypothetical protein
VTGVAYVTPPFGGQDQSWVSYVSSIMQSAVQQSLRATDGTTESFTGTISYFGTRVIPDPLVHGDLAVSSCFDNAGSSNTNLSTGAVLPDTSPADSHYVRITAELRKDSAGQWQVTSSLPAVYYPRAEECKPARLRSAYARSSPSTADMSGVSRLTCCEAINWNGAA